MWERVRFRLARRTVAGGTRPPRVRTGAKTTQAVPITALHAPPRMRSSASKWVRRGLPESVRQIAVPGAPQRHAPRVMVVLTAGLPIIARPLVSRMCPLASPPRVCMSATLMVRASEPRPLNVPTRRVKKRVRMALSAPRLLHPAPVQPLIVCQASASNARGLQPPATPARRTL